MRTLGWAAAAGALFLSGCVATMLHWTPLEDAAYNGDASKVEALLAQGAAPGETDPNGGDAASLAVEVHPEVSRIVLRKCLSLELPAQKCPRGLSAAARLGDRELVAAFLSKGAQPAPESLAGAAISGNAEIANLLADKGASIDAASVMLEKRIADFERMSAGAGMGGSVVSAMRPKIETYRRGLQLLNRMRTERVSAAEAQPAAAKPADWWAK